VTTTEDVRTTDVVPTDPAPATTTAAVTAGGDRYTIVSADTHAGGDIGDYRPYLPARWHDEFDAWAATYENPFADLLAATAYRSWDSERRLAEHEADGVAAEVIFPNTVPPFFEEGNLVALPPTAADYERRWAGAQAHNRWLADFCAAAPGRRAGVAQVFLNDVDDALAEIRRAAETFRPFGGVLLPGIPPGAGMPPLWESVYEPVWALCEELGVPVNIHGGSGLPDYGEHEAARAMMLIELPWFSHRSIWHLVFSGVFERHPELRVVLTEQGVAWLPRGLETLDWFYRRMTLPEAAEAKFFGAVAASMSMTPSEYFHRNVWVGASFLRPSESPLRYDVGVDHIMWGDDYPHTEGSYPHTREALRVAFADCPTDEVRRMVETNAAQFYGFDLDRLRPIGARIGPTVAEVATPLTPDAYPSDSTCNAFDTAQVLRSW
jgi:predicted TIM-barrel fold metal-dependent hydrolase